MTNEEINLYHKAKELYKIIDHYYINEITNLDFFAQLKLISFLKILNTLQSNDNSFQENLNQYNSIVNYKLVQLIISQHHHLETFL